EGPHYPMDPVRLFTPPSRPIRIWMAAAGPRSATLAGEVADGVITSVKDVERSAVEVIEPYRRAAASAGRTPSVAATRWTILASSEEEAWRALGPMRGLRVPGRARGAAPGELRVEADSMPRTDVLARYPMARDSDAL